MTVVNRLVWDLIHLSSTKVSSWEKSNYSLIGSVKQVIVYLHNGVLGSHKIWRSDLYSDVTNSKQFLKISTEARKVYIINQPISLCVYIHTFVAYADNISESQWKNWVLWLLPGRIISRYIWVGGRIALYGFLNHLNFDLGEWITYARK